MSSFSSPAWDVDESAKILCDKFLRDRKSSVNKNSRKEKHRANFDVRHGNVKEKFTSNPKFNTSKQKKLSSKVRLKTKNRNFSEQVRTNKNKNSPGSNGVNFQNQVNKTSIGKGQNLLKNDLSYGTKKNVKVNNSYPSDFSSKNLKKKKNKKRIQTKTFRENTPVNRKCDSKSTEQGFQESRKYIKQNVEAEYPGNDSSNRVTNTKQNNRKRTISQVSKFQNSVVDFKKRKFGGNTSDQPKSLHVQNQTSKSRNKLIENTFNKRSENIINTNFKNNSINEIKNMDNSTRKLNKNENFKKLSKNVENQQSIKNYKLNSNIKEAKEKDDPSINALKNPYSGKKKFLDSSVSLRERMLLQLKSSRFRYINEQLYTSDSKDAGDIFKTDPDLFQIYHEGFKQQVEQWPLNPVDRIIKAIQRKPTHLVVADFGCGDAKIAKSVSNKVHSFDLVALTNEVTVCDMAHTPLENGSIDICVFCLSLMGTNLGNYLTEANRVLKVGGTLKIAEVASRFDSVEGFVKDVKKYGFSLLNKDVSHDLFYFLNFNKDSNIKKVKGLPEPSLKPCLYKKR